VLKFLRLYLPAILLVGMVTACGSATETEQDKYPNETAGQKNARRTAERYLSASSFSRTELIKQLELEKLSTGDAEYAVKALRPDWKMEAVESATSYLRGSSYFAREGVIAELKHEGFTDEEAEYAAAQAYRQVASRQ
jgi:hypothetical protein